MLVPPGLIVRDNLPLGILQARSFARIWECIPNQSLHNPQKREPIVKLHGKERQTLSETTKQKLKY